MRRHRASSPYTVTHRSRRWRKLPSASHFILAVDRAVSDWDRPSAQQVLSELWLKWSIDHRNESLQVEMPREDLLLVMSIHGGEIYGGLGEDLLTI